MKVGINSKTIRVQADNGAILDYHVLDGRSSSHLLGMIDNGLRYYMSEVCKYESVSVNSMDDPLSWGVEGIDKFESIHYVDISRVEKTTQKNTGYTYSAYIPIRQQTIYPTYAPKPPQRSQTDIDNEAAFKKIFGK